MSIEKSERICVFCERAVSLFDEDNMLCNLCGVVPKGYTCRRFSYDPLKRIPPKGLAAPTLEFIDIDE